MAGAACTRPYGLKDIIDYAGLPTTAHSKILQDNVARDDACCTKLRAAGGVFMGKLSTHEFAIGGPSFDLPGRCAQSVEPGSLLRRFLQRSGSATRQVGAVAIGPIRRLGAQSCLHVGRGWNEATYGLVSRRGVRRWPFRSITSGR